MKRAFHLLPPSAQRTVRALRNPLRAATRFRLIESLKKEQPSRDHIARLKDAWGGKAVGDVDYLLEVIHQARKAQGPILECGSGLTTLLLGLYANQQTVYSLEESSYWAKRISVALRWHRIGNVSIYEAPIRDYNAFSWYTVPPHLPSSFSLVVCDGPTSHDKPGIPRYGLLPIMGACISGAPILVDDISRPNEQLALDRWEQEYGARVARADVPSRPYATVTI